MFSKPSAIPLLKKESNKVLVTVQYITLFIVNDRHDLANAVQRCISPNRDQVHYARWEQMCTSSSLLRTPALLRHSLLVS